MIYLMCGKICSGKSTHSESLRKEKKAVVLSVDEITLALFGQDTGEKHDDHVAAAEEYLYLKSLEIAENGIDVILDWASGLRMSETMPVNFTAHGISPLNFIT